MSKPNVKINGVTYNTVPYVQIPLSGTSGNASFYYIADGDATAADILSGKKAYSGSGEITGSLSVVSVSQDGGTKVLSIS